MYNGFEAAVCEAVGVLVLVYVPEECLTDEV